MYETKVLHSSGITDAAVQLLTVPYQTAPFLNVALRHQEMKSDLKGTLKMLEEPFALSHKEENSSLQVLFSSDFRLSIAEY